MFVFPLNISAVISDLMMAMLFDVSEFMTYNFRILPLKVGSPEVLSFSFQRTDFLRFYASFERNVAKMPLLASPYLPCLSACHIPGTPEQNFIKCCIGEFY
jgi:hypothetical protein